MLTAITTSSLLRTSQPQEFCSLHAYRDYNLADLALERIKRAFTAEIFSCSLQSAQHIIAELLVASCVHLKSLDDHLACMEAVIIFLPHQ